MEEKTIWFRATEENFNKLPKNFREDYLRQLLTNDFTWRNFSSLSCFLETDIFRCVISAKGKPLQLNWFDIGEIPSFCKLHEVFHLKHIKRRE